MPNSFSSHRCKSPLKWGDTIVNHKNLYVGPQIGVYGVFCIQKPIKCLYIGSSIRLTKRTARFFCNLDYVQSVDNFMFKFFLKGVGVENIFCKIKTFDSTEGLENMEQLFMNHYKPCFNKCRAYKNSGWNQNTNYTLSGDLVKVRTI